MSALEWQPEVFVLNLQWNGEPSPPDILKILAAIPNAFKTDCLFPDSSLDPAHYLFKGMIAFQTAHYMSFFR